MQLLLLATILLSFSLSLSSATQVKKQKRKDPLLVFMCKPQDFENDFDVNFMAMKLHHPDVVESFYRAAAQTFTDLQALMAEAGKDRQLAQKLLEINSELVELSAAAPLTTAHMIFSIGERIQPLLKHPSPVFDSLAARTRELKAQEAHEASNQPSTIAVIKRFFRHFALPEMQFIELVCNLLSQVRILKRPNKDGFVVDASATGLVGVERRVLLTLANALAKMDLLLTLFMTEPTALERSLRLIVKLWRVHLTRRPPHPADAFDESFMDANSYQKEPIHFTFPDWTPEVDVSRQVALLQIKREKLLKRWEAEQALQLMLKRSAERPATGMWTAVLILLVIILIVFATVAYRLIQSQRLQQQKSTADL